MRIVTDPVVDAFMVVLSELVVPPLSTLASKFAASAYLAALSTISLAFGEEAEHTLADYAHDTVSKPSKTDEFIINVVAS